MPRILVVDDDDAVREVWSDLLWTQGYEVEGAKVGRDVIPTLERQGFDLLILDVLLPHVNGFTVLEELRAHDELHELPVIMVSGLYRAQKHREQMMQRFGIIDYLDKPVSPSRLVALVEGAVGAPPTTRELRRPTQAAMSASQAARLVDDEAHEERQQVEQDARRGFKKSPFSIQGSIDKTPVAAVLGGLWRQRACGALLLRHDKVKKIVYVHQGSAYNVHSNLVGECLGQLLVRERLITAAECEASIAALHETSKRQGEVLVDQGSLTPRNLMFALGLQLETKLFETFAWPSGAYRFNSSAKLPAHDHVLDWQGAAIITEGIRRCMDETRLRELMRPVLEVPLQRRADSGAWPEIGLSETEKESIAKLSLPASTNDMLLQLPLTPAESLRLVYTLIAVKELLPAP